MTSLDQGWLFLVGSATVWTPEEGAVPLWLRLIRLLERSVGPSGLGDPQGRAIVVDPQTLSAFVVKVSQNPDERFRLLWRGPTVMAWALLRAANAAGIPDDPECSRDWRDQAAHLQTVWFRCLA